MNWPRYMKALEAQAMEDLEDRRNMQMTGELKGSDLSKRDWDQIAEHDEIIKEIESS